MLAGVSAAAIALAALITPMVPSGKTQAPSIMIGYRCANFILGLETA